MLLLLVAVAIVVAAVVLLGGGAALGAGGGGGQGRRGMPGGAVPALGLLGAVGMVGVIALAGLAVFGVRGGGPAGGPATGVAPAGRSGTTTTSLPAGAALAVTTAPGAVAGRLSGEPVPGAEVRISPLAESAFADPVRVVDGLAEATVLRVTASGFVPDTTGEVAQCARGRTGSGGCRDRFPVRFDATGAARFQYLVSSGGAPGGCRDGAGCFLSLRGEDDRSALVPLVFAARSAPAGSVVVTPRRGLEDGQVVQVSVAGMAAGSRVQVVQCVPPGLPVAERCGAPGPVVPLVVGADGRASTTLTVSVGAVGAERHPCRRGSGCGVAVVSGGVLLRAPVVPVAFSAGAGASYDRGRLAAGMAAAAALLALGVWLVRTTDWREPTEASTPALDAARLADP